MLPRQSFHTDQTGGDTVSSTVSTSSFDAAPEPIDNLIEKMSYTSFEDKMCPETGVNDLQSTRTKQNVMEFGIDIDEMMDVTSDENETADNVSSLVPVDEMVNTTKIDNLEHLPADILAKIFNRTDDIGLMHLAEISYRFAAIGKIFVISGERLGGDRHDYSKKLKQFDSSIETVYINHAENIDANHWVVKLLQPQIDNIKKLTFDSCTFTAKNIFSGPLDNITHLISRHRCRDFHTQVVGDSSRMTNLPECHNLTKLEVHEMRGQKFSIDSLQRIIRNSPSLQSLLLYGFDIPEMSLWQMLTLIANHSNQVKELALMMNSKWDSDYCCVELQTINQLFKSFEHLESLSLSIDPSTIQLLQRFGTECAKIKHLGLHIYGAYDEAQWNGILTNVARSFQRIVSFYYYSYESIERDIEPFVAQLPNLRHLHIEPSYQDDIECSDALPLLHECPTLQKISIVFKHKCDGYPVTFISAQFFEEFIDTITNSGKPNASIDIEERSQVIGSATKNGIVWRNKLMFWMDCDKNDTNVNLLHLAEHPKESNGPQIGAHKLNLLDCICEYLDVASIHSLSETCKRAEELVMSYVKKNLDKHGMFTITDEIHPFESLNYCYTFDELGLTEHVTDLKVYALRSESKIEVIDAIQRLQHLDKLSIYDENPQERWPYSLSGISHVVYDSSHFMDSSDLTDTIDTFPDAQAIECKKAGQFNDFKSGKSKTPDCRNLKEFKFNCRGETQMANLKEIFKTTNTRLVPVSPKTASTEK